MIIGRLYCHCEWRSPSRDQCHPRLRRGTLQGGVELTTSARRSSGGRPPPQILQSDGDGFAGLGVIVEDPVTDLHLERSADLRLD